MFLHLNLYPAQMGPHPWVLGQLASSFSGSLGGGSATVGAGSGPVGASDSWRSRHFGSLPWGESSWPWSPKVVTLVTSWRWGLAFFKLKGPKVFLTCQSADVQCRTEDPAWAAWPSTSNFTNSVLEMAFLISSDLTKQENLAQESLMFHTFEKHPFLGKSWASKFWSENQIRRGQISAFGKGPFQQLCPALLHLLNKRILGRTQLDITNYQRRKKAANSEDLTYVSFLVSKTSWQTICRLMQSESPFLRKAL